MSALSEFQDELARVLLWSADGSGHEERFAPAQAGLAVYRNTVMKGMLDALAANYPSVERLVGKEWFDAAATQYATAHLPNEPCMALYGATFPQFLAAFPPAAELPYLADVARLDRLWTEAHFAADGPTLSARDLVALQPEELFHQRLTLHGAARCGWFTHSAVTLWQLNRPPAPPPDEITCDDCEEGALITRPHGAICVWTLSGAEHEFLAQIQAGYSLGDAAIAALEHEPTTHMADLLARLINAGAFEK